MNRIPILASACFLLAHIIIGTTETPSVWGVDFLRYSPWPWGGFIGLAVLILAGIRPRWFAPFDRLLPGSSAPLALLIVLPVISIAYPSSLHLLGDGYLLIRELDAEAWENLARTDRAPLTFWIMIRLFRFFHWAGKDAEFTYRTMSLLSGLAYALLCPVVSVALSEDRKQRSIITASLLTAGYVQLFCGYVENYAPLYPGMLLLLTLMIRALRNRGPLWPAGLILGLLCALHFSSVFLVPGIFSAGYLYGRSRGIFRSTLEMISFPITVLTILWLIGFDFSAYVSETQSHVLPLFGPMPYNSAYALLSFAHLGDLLNVLLLSAPLALIVMPSLRLRDVLGDDVKTVLVVTLAGPLLFVLIANPEIGAFRDWDVLSLPALPLLVLTGYAWSARSPDGRVVVLVFATVALHTLLWIGVNAEPSSATLRYESLLKTVSLSTHGKVYGWETLGSYARDVGEPDNAIKAYKRALEANPDHARLWLLLGNAYQETNRLESATSAYEKTIKLRPGMREAHSNLGVIKVRMGKNDEALTYLDQAIRIAPTFADAYLNRGVALANLERADEAISSLRHAIALDPEYGNAYKNLATIYMRKGMRDSAQYFQSLARSAK